MVRPLVKRHDRGMSRLSSLALLVVVACGKGAGGKPAPDPATSSGPGIAGLLACKSLARAIDAVIACGKTPDERRLAELSLKLVRELHTDPRPLPPEAAPMFAHGCVALLDDTIEALRWQGCAFTPTADERAWVAAQRKTRTGVPAGASAATRASLESLMAARDEVCRCADVACVQATQQKLDAGLKPLPPDASDAARDAGGKMIDEAMLCGRRIEHAEARKAPYQPPSPDEVKRMLAIAEESAARPPGVLDDGDVEEHEPDEEEEEDEQPGSDVVVPFR